MGLALAVNRAVRQPDEWFEEPDDLDRVERALGAIEFIDDPVEAAAVLACRLTRTQGFTEATNARPSSSPGGSSTETAWTGRGSFRRATVSSPNSSSALPPGSTSRAKRSPY